MSWDSPASDSQRGLYCISWVDAIQGIPGGTNRSSVSPSALIYNSFLEKVTTEPLSGMEACSPEYRWPIIKEVIQLHQHYSENELFRFPQRLTLRLIH